MPAYGDTDFTVGLVALTIDGRNIATVASSIQEADLRAATADLTVEQGPEVVELQWDLSAAESLQETLLEGDP